MSEMFSCIQAYTQAIIGIEEGIGIDDPGKKHVQQLPWVPSGQPLAPEFVDPLQPQDVYGSHVMKK